MDCIKDDNIIGDRLRTLRGSKTIREVSEKIKISESALAMYESGKRIPRDEIKVRIAKYYKKTVGSIFFS